MANESTKTVKRMTRAQIKETLDKTPIEHILGTKQPLTNKQREFARKVALGSMGVLSNVSLICALVMRLTVFVLSLVISSPCNLLHLIVSIYQ